VVEDSSPHVDAGGKEFEDIATTHDKLQHQSLQATPPPPIRIGPPTILINSGSILPRAGALSTIRINAGAPVPWIDPIMNHVWRADCFFYAERLHFVLLSLEIPTKMNCAVLTGM
jgi:hypothetical protein